MIKRGLSDIDLQNLLEATKNGLCRSNEFLNDNQAKRSNTKKNFRQKENETLVYRLQPALPFKPSLTGRLPKAQLY